MYKIVRKVSLNPTVTLMEVDAPFVAKKAEPGQFIILIVVGLSHWQPLYETLAYESTLNYKVHVFVTLLY